jgi:hypothetical protein
LFERCLAVIEAKRPDKVRAHCGRDGEALGVHAIVTALQPQRYRLVVKRVQPADIEWQGCAQCTC